MTITIPYKPRPAFKPFHNRKERWAVLVVHRRGGKTVAVVNDLVKQALLCTKEAPRYGYIAPTYAQAKDVAWMYLCRFASPIPGVIISQSELSVTFPNGARIRLYGADNYERLRGIYLDGCVIDESADMAPQAWSEILRPALADRQGWCVWIGTPKGRDAFWRIWQDAQGNPEWYSLLLPASKSGLLPEPELVASKRQMVAIMGEARGNAAYEQEFECSFNAPIVGSIYGGEVTRARGEGRINGNVMPYEGIPVYTAFDIGAPENTKCWTFQAIGDRINLLDCLTGGEDCKTPGAWAARLTALPYRYGSHFLPHDGAVLWRELLAQAGLTNVVVLERQVGEWTNIEGAQAAFGRCWFRIPTCDDGIESLEAFRAKPESDGITIKNVPVHDYASHAATAFGYIHQAIRLGMLVDRSAMPSRPKRQHYGRPQNLTAVGASMGLGKPKRSTRGDDW